MSDAMEGIDTGATPPFADLLRHHRTGAALTQEELAERAGLSRNAISALERGERSRPQRATVELLATALGLAGDDLDVFATAARSGPIESPPVAGPPSNLPLPPTPLFGREDVLDRASDLLQQGHVRLLTLTGPGGVGKTRLAVEMATHLRPGFADGTFLVELAPVAISHGRPHQAVLLLAAAGALRETLGAPRPPDEQTSHDRALRAAFAALPAGTFAMAWEEGAGRSLAEAVAIASAHRDTIPAAT
jgi:transcriptional regulator with XRE-family HTH domain